MSIKSFLNKIGNRITGKGAWGDLWKIAKENKLFQQEVNEPYTQVPNVFKAIKAIADNAPQAKLRFYNKKTKEEIEDQNLNDLFYGYSKPNPMMSYNDFIQAVVGFYALYGEVKIIKADSLKSRQEKLPAGLYPVKPSKLQPLHTTQFPAELKGWRSGKETFEPEEVIFAKDFNPNSYFSGISPTKPLQKIIDIDWKGLCFNSSFFENSATLGLSLSTDKGLSNDQRKRLEQWVKHHYQGHTKAFRTIILEAGLEAKQIGSTHKDMEFTEQMKYTREETLGVFRTPKALFNITDDLQYATFVGQMKVFWQYGLMPVLRKIEDVFNKDLIQGYNPNIYCEFDTSEVPAFKEDFEKNVDNALKLFKIGIPLNQIIKRLNLGFDEIEGGDVGYVPFNLMPIGSPGKSEQEGKTKVETKEEDKYSLDALIWKSFLNRHQVLEGKFKSALSRYFYDQRKKVLEQVNKGFGHKQDSAAINIDIDWEEQNEELQKRSRPYLAGGLSAGIDFGREMIEQEVEEQVLQYEMRSMLQEGTRTITRINETVREQTEAQLAEAIKNGETIQQASERIRDTYNKATSRTKTIARTEMTKALNGGHQLYAEKTGMSWKRWITAGDEYVRARHRILSGETVKMKESFSNGLKYPGAIGGRAEEVINCRCVLKYLTKKEEA